MPFTVGGRVQLPFDGRYQGLVCEVDSLDAEPVLFYVLSLANAYAASEGGDAEVAALRALYGFVEAIARPVWNVVDPKGPVSATVAGFLRVRVELMLRLVELWTETYVPPPPPDPIDAMKADIEARAAVIEATRIEDDSDPEP